MKIEIKERFKPYMHVCGTKVILPQSHYVLQVFPTLVLVFDTQIFSSQEVLRKQIPLTGPVENFSVQLDLEKGLVRVWGNTDGQEFRYIIVYQNQTVQFYFEKGFDQLSKPQPLLHASHLQERLFLGNHKSQDMELIRRRLDIAEFFPLWHSIGRQVPKQNCIQAPCLLERCRTLIENKDKLAIEKAFVGLYRAGIEQLFAPRAQDSDYQGYSLEPLTADHSTLTLLSEGSALIRSLFLQVIGKDVYLLPVLPPSLHCGKLTFATTSVGTFWIEWSKKMMRRLVFLPLYDQQITFHFQNKIKSFRLKTPSSSVKSIQACPTVLDVLKENFYYFDRFEK